MSLLGSDCVGRLPIDTISSPVRILAEAAAERGWSGALYHHSTVFLLRRDTEMLEIDIYSIYS